MKSTKLKKTGKIHDTLTGYDFNVDQALSRSKAIRTKCLECCAGNSAEVDRCTISDCALYPYRSAKARKLAQSEGRMAKRAMPQNATEQFRKRS